jgi:hypothetical protein
MKSIKNIFFSLLLVAVSLTSAYAQHSHDAPRGGVLQEAGGYHIEMLKSRDTHNFYVMDGSNKFIDKEMTAEMDYEFYDQTTSTVKLIRCKSGSLCAALPNNKIFTYARVSFKVDGKSFFPFSETRLAMLNGSTVMNIKKS